MTEEQYFEITNRLDTLLNRVESFLARLPESRPVGRPRKAIGAPVKGVQQAIEFLQSNQLVDDWGDIVPAEEILAESEARGINKTYLMEAKRQLGIQSIHQRDRKWHWVLRVAHPATGISVPFESLTDEEKALVEVSPQGGSQPVPVAAEGEAKSAQGEDGTSLQAPSPSPSIPRADGWRPGE